MADLLTLLEYGLGFIIIVSIIAVAYWRNSIFFYLIAVPMAIVFGLSMAAEYDNGSALWVAGIIIAIIGTGCLFKAIIMSLENVRFRRR